MGVAFILWLPEQALSIWALLTFLRSFPEPKDQETLGSLGILWCVQGEESQGLERQPDGREREAGSDM